MYMKKIVPILALIAISGVFLMGVQAVSAAHTTEVKAYTYDAIYSPEGEIGSSMDLTKGYTFDIAATLHVDGGNQQWFRSITYNVYNSNGDQIVNEERSTGFGGIARCRINTKEWDYGNYLVKVSYLGNDKDEYPGAEKKFTLHIVKNLD